MNLLKKNTQLHLLKLSWWYQLGKIRGWPKSKKQKLRNEKFIKDMKISHIPGDLEGYSHL